MERASGHGWLGRLAGFGELTASSPVGGVTSPSSRRNGRKDVLWEQVGCLHCEPTETIEQGLPDGQVGNQTRGERAKLKEKRCFVTCTLTCTPPSS